MADAVITGVYRFDGSNDVTVAPPSGFANANATPATVLAVSRWDIFANDLDLVWPTVAVGSLLDAVKANDADQRARYVIGGPPADVGDGFAIPVTLHSAAGTPMVTPDPVTFTVWPPAPAVAWATVVDVGNYVGLAPTDPGDVEYLAAVTDAANQWAFRARLGAGYRDDPATSPGPDVTLAVTLAGGAWFRRRGAVDGFAGWVELGQVPGPFGGLTDVRRLLGIPRPLAV